MMRKLAILGSTGSIGRQAIAVARQTPGRLQITGLAAGGGDVALLATARRVETALGR